MQSKQIITIIVIIAAFAGAGVFAYMAFSGNASENIITEVASDSQVLPFGDELNFDSIDTFNPTGKAFQYSEVAPSEVGSPLNNIVQ